MPTVQKTPELSASDVAKYFIWKAQQEKKSITNKKLQKLLYYAQAWNLVFKNKPLFKEDIEAWVHGPTVPAVYHEYKKYGYSPIVDKKIKAARIKKIPNRDVIDAVWEAYGRKYDADYLEILAHNEKPWQVAREGVSSGNVSSNVISLDLMKEYYSRLLEQLTKE